ncbi:hypothetical protein REPUB_Repub13aG0055200 [Reevesia pubescens]
MASLTREELAIDFVKSYYFQLCESSKDIHKFYNDSSSKLIRLGPDGVLHHWKIFEAIDDPLFSHFDCKDCDIFSIDTQLSIGLGVHVLVIGSMTMVNNTSKKFIQSFVLVPMNKPIPFFILNDVLRFLDIEETCVQEPIDDIRSKEAKAVQEVQKADHEESINCTADPSLDHVVTDDIAHVTSDPSLDPNPNPNEVVEEVLKDVIAAATTDSIDDPSLDHVSTADIVAPRKDVPAAVVNALNDEDNDDPFKGTPLSLLLLTGLLAGLQTPMLCSTGLPSDVIVEVGEMSFHLHKFPLLSRSRVIENLIKDYAGGDEKKCVLQFHDLPGGAKTFLLVAKFCYGIRLELTAQNIVSLRCAAEYLQMSEDHGEANLITQTENFLKEIFGNWTDTIKALETCEEVLPYSEEIHIVSRCINSLAMKACADLSLFSWPISESGTAPSSEGTHVLWNGICAAAKPRSMSEDWWYEDVSFLRLSLYKRLILAIESSGMKSERIAGSLVHYAKRHLPLLGRLSSFQNGSHAALESTMSPLPDADQRNLLEEIVALIPNQKGATPTNFLLRLLRTSMILNARPSCREKLEKQIGAQLDQAALEDLLIPNMGYYLETLYDIDCVQRILDHFVLVDHEALESSSNYMVDEAHLIGGSHPLTPMTMVANLVDGYLAEVAPDVNLKLPKFQSLAAVIPDYARPLDDGIYRAIDVYLKAHPWLTDSEKEQICRLMNCQKLSLEASTHATQNERLPLRFIVQVLFFEQLRLRTSIAGWFFVSDNLENSQNPNGNLAITRNNASAQVGTTQDHFLEVDDIMERVSELEKECLSMKEELEKLMKTKGGWNIFLKKIGFRSKSKSSDPKTTKSSDSKKSKPCDSKKSATASFTNGRENQNNSESGLQVLKEN